jgi:oxygen-dependent protoporphyrinogen oxidase
MKIAIIGAGISGLSAAHFTLKKFPDANVTIFERTERIGGNIRTEHHEGFTFEFGPRYFDGKSEELLEIVDDIGLWEDLVTSEKVAQKKFVFRKNEFFEIPANLRQAFRNKIIKKPFRTLLREWKTKPVDVYDSVKIFSDRHFGHEATQYLVDPTFSGLCAGNITKLSTNAILSEYKDMEREYGSILKGIWKRKNGFVASEKKYEKFRKERYVSINGGLQRLADAIIEKNKINVLFNQHIQGIKQINNGDIEIKVDDSIYKYDKVIVTTPSFVSAHILRDANEEFYKSLGLVKYAPLALINIGFEEDVKRKKGFGYFIPQRERQKVLGVIYNNDVFAQTAPIDGLNLSVMMGGMNQIDMMDNTANELVKIALNHLKRHLDIQEKPEIVKIRQYSRAIPQYNMGIEKVWARLDEVKKKYKNILLGGNYQYGLQMDDAVRQSKKIVDSL